MESSVRSGEADATVPASENAAELRHLAIFLADLHGGGAERMMVQLAGGIAAHGVRVDLVLARAEGPFLTEVSSAVRVIDLQRTGSLAATLPLVTYLRRERPDGLLSTLHHASVVAAVARLLAGSASALFIREANTPSGRRMLPFDLKARAIELGMRWAYSSADAIVAVSEGVADDLKRTRHVPERKLWTLYNPVISSDLQQLMACNPEHPWLQSTDSEPPVVLAVGSLQPRKGFRTLIQAFARVRANRDVRLIILGEGPQRSELEVLARELGVADDVDLPGFNVNPFAFMARAAVFVLASEREGLPGVLIQAMACGCPVVATDCPSGPREILEGGRHGLLVPVGDAKRMADAIEVLFSSPPDTSGPIARAARFDSDRVSMTHVEVFDRTIREIRHGGGGNGR